MQTAGTDELELSLKMQNIDNTFRRCSSFIFFLNIALKVLKNMMCVFFFFNVLVFLNLQVAELPSTT